MKLQSIINCFNAVAVRILALLALSSLCFHGNFARAGTLTLNTISTSTQLSTIGSLQGTTLSTDTTSLISGTIIFERNLYSYYRPGLFLSAKIHLNNSAAETMKADVENDWLPHVLTLQAPDANPEALKAIAVADRSILYYALTAQGWIGDGGMVPDYDPHLTPSPAAIAAVNATSREILKTNFFPTIKNHLGSKEPFVIGYTVPGARPSLTGTAKFGVAEPGDLDPSNTEQYVTYNAGRNLAKTQATTLGKPITSYPGENLGALSIQGDDFLADHRYDYLDILRFYYGDGPQLTLGTYKVHVNGDLSLTTKISFRNSAPRKLLSDFEANAGFLQSSIQSNPSDMNLNFAPGGTNSHLTTEKAYEGKSSERINIDDSESDGKNRGFRLSIPSGLGPRTAFQPSGNLLLPSDGNIGLFLNTQTPGLSVRMLVDVTGYSRISSTHKLIADGQWHRYSWEVADDAHWDGASPGLAFTLNSIMIQGSSDAVLYMDNLFFDETTTAAFSSPTNFTPSSLGVLTPEPTMCGFAAFSLVFFSRRRRLRPAP